MGTSKIEWTEATWNPVTGCTPISEGCEHCYAKRMAIRLRGRCGYPEKEPFQVTVHDERLEQPLKWGAHRKVFVCSMGDLFHEDVSDENLDDVFDVMALASHHIFQVLTKRPHRMREYMSRLADRIGYGDLYWECDRDVSGDTDPDFSDAQMNRWIKKITRLESGMANVSNLKRDGKPLPNLWLGVTAENQRRADERIPVLLDTPAARRFVSVEPMLGPVDLSQWLGRSGGLDWVICGGETGPGARPVHPDWVRSLRDQCQIAGVPFFFKSWGEWREANMDLPVRGTKFGCFMGDTFVPDYGNVFPQRYPEHINMTRIGKSNAGRILDGRTWDEEPEDVNVSKEVR